MGLTDAGDDDAVGHSWQEAYEKVFIPAHDDWARRVEAVRESETGRRAIEDQARRAEEFEQLIERFERESAKACELCGAAARSPARSRSGRGTRSGATLAAKTAGSGQSHAKNNVTEMLRSASRQS